jgi:hypothetical protein
MPDEKLQGPHPVNANRVDNSKPNPKSGTVQLEFNKTGTLLLARFGTIRGTRVLRRSANVGVIKPM